MQSLTDQIDRSDLFKRLYPAVSTGDFAALTHALSPVPPWYQAMIRAHHPGFYEPTVETHTEALLLPLLSQKAHIPRSRIVEYLAYSGNGEPIDAACHVKPAYKGFSDHPQLPAPGQPWPIKPDRIDRPAYYMGLMIRHYGHFILETLTRFWFALQQPLPADSCFVFHLHGPTKYENRSDSTIIGELFRGFWGEYFRALGIRPEAIRFIHQPTLCRELIVPQQATVINDGWGCDCYASDAAASVWRALNQRMAPGSKPWFFQPGYNDRIYISRRRVAQPFRNRQLDNEQQVEELFRSRGFSILFPESLKSERHKQFILSRTRIVAGASGSGLLNSVFMPAGGHTFSIINEQTTRGIPSFEHQTTMDAVAGHRSYCYFEPADTPSGERRAAIDIQALTAALDQFLTRTGATR